MTKIFNFNHIDKEANNPDDITELRSLYAFYHRKKWLYEQSFKYFKRLNLLLTITSGVLVAVGGGTIVLTPIALAVLSVSAITISTIQNTKSLPEKMRMSKYAFQSYDKILCQIRCFLRGEPYGIAKHDFLQQLKFIDEQVSDLAPLPKERYKEKYEKKYSIKSDSSINQ